MRDLLYLAAYSGSWIRLVVRTTHFTELSFPEEIRAEVYNVRRAFKDLNAFDYWESHGTTRAFGVTHYR